MKTFLWWHLFRCTKFNDVKDLFWKYVCKEKKNCDEKNVVMKKCRIKKLLTKFVIKKVLRWRKKCCDEIIVVKNDKTKKKSIIEKIFIKKTF